MIEWTRVVAFSAGAITLGLRYPELSGYALGALALMAVPAATAFVRRFTR